MRIIELLINEIRLAIMTNNQSLALAQLSNLEMELARGTVTNISIGVSDQIKISESIR